MKLRIIAPLFAALTIASGFGARAEALKLKITNATSTHVLNRIDTYSKGGPLKTSASIPWNKLPASRLEAGERTTAVVDLPFEVGYVNVAYGAEGHACCWVSFSSPGVFEEFTTKSHGKLDITVEKKWYGYKAAITDRRDL